MANAGLFVGWGEVVRGRERVSLKVFDEFIRFCTAAQQRGDIESFEPVALEQHGGDLYGFVLIRGDADKLARLRNTEEFARQLLRGSAVVDNIGVVSASIGEGMQRQFETYLPSIEDIV